ncbi:MAG: hypothetical protein ACK5HP_04175 [Bacilli bacterium]
MSKIEEKNIILKIITKYFIELLFMTLPLTYTKVGIKFTKKIHTVLRKQFAASLPKKIEIRNNFYEKSNKSTIYVANHVYFDDIATILCAIDDNIYLVADSDTKNDISILEAVALYLNGIILFEKDKDLAKPNEKEILEKNIQKVLKNGGNLQLHIESTWNFSSNRIIRDDLPYGVFRYAKNTGNSDIVPVATDEVNGVYCLNIGKKFEPTGNNCKDIVSLRDALATESFDLIVEKEPLIRKEIGNPDDFWRKQIEDRCKGDTSQYDFEKEERCAFKIPGKDSIFEVVAQLHDIPYKSLVNDYKTYREIVKLVELFTQGSYIPQNNKTIIEQEKIKMKGR